MRAARALVPALALLVLIGCSACALRAPITGGPLRSQLGALAFISHTVTDQVTGVAGKRYCTAFYITPDHLLTAAHCTGPDLVQWVGEEDSVDLDLMELDVRHDIALLKSPRRSHQFLDLSPQLPPADTEVWTHTVFGHNASLQSLVVRSRVVHPVLTLVQGWELGLVVRPGYIPGQSGSPIVLKNGQVISVAHGTVAPMGTSMGHGAALHAIYELLAKGFPAL